MKTNQLWVIFWQLMTYTIFVLNVLGVSRIHIIVPAVTLLLEQLQDMRKKEMNRRITMELTLFLENGKTLVFENVTNIKQDSYITSMVEFKYISASDGKKKRAVFSLNNVIGLSVDKEDFDVNSLF